MFLPAPHELSRSRTEVGGRGHVTHLLRQVPANRHTRLGRGSFSALDSKANARAVLKAARAAFPPKQRAIESAAAVRALLESDLLNGAKTVALYAALAEEADPIALEEPLRSRGASIAYPRVTPAGLTFHLARSQELRPTGPFKIREPDATGPITTTEIDVFIVPGLGFTRDGHRIGYGRGYYDRVLAS